jgi:hypothetical protein
MLRPIFSLISGSNLLALRQRAARKHDFSENFGKLRTLMGYDTANAARPYDEDFCHESSKLASSRVQSKLNKFSDLPIQQT